jgi:hypothetical protein
VQVLFPTLPQTQSHVTAFKDRMTLHRDKFLVTKTNRRTEFQIYWYYDSTRFGRPFRPSAEVLSRTSALVHFMQFCMTVCYQDQDGTASTGSNCIKCTNARLILCFHIGSPGYVTIQNGGRITKPDVPIVYLEHGTRRPPDLMPQPRQCSPSPPWKTQYISNKKYIFNYLLNREAL